jgi:small subunit ribosomal protein S27e
MTANRKVREPTSKFLEVECMKCGEKNVVFNKASSKVACRKCGESIAEPMGGFAMIAGKVLKELE